MKKNQAVVLQLAGELTTEEARHQMEEVTLTYKIFYLPLLSSCNIVKRFDL